MKILGHLRGKNRVTIYWAFSAIEKQLFQIQRGTNLNRLGDEERGYLQTLRFEKRRKEWLAGRLALKQLLKNAIPEYSQLGFEEIQILKAQSGEPYILIKPANTVADRISLSHSNGFLFCACTNQAQPLGVDLESIEDRSQDFVQDFFTQDEVKQIALLPAEDYSLYSTMIWSAKEAVLKALSIGLSVDTRRINIDPSYFYPHSTDWKEIRFTTTLLQSETLRLFGRRVNSFVLTICVGGDGTACFSQVEI